MKRIISVLLTITMLLGVIASVPLTVSAATTDKVESGSLYTDRYGEWIYEQTDDGKGYKITDFYPNYPQDDYPNDYPYYYPNTFDIEIPGSIKGVPVLEIGSDAFSDCDNVSSIKIPNGITTIGDFAFINCLALGKIGIPSSVTHIGDYAFYGCNNIGEIGIPSGITYIGNGAFNDCYYSTVYYGGSESDWANISLYTGLEYANIIFMVSSGTYTDEYGEWTYGVSTDSLGYKITGYDESMTEIKIPEFINGIDVLEIGDNAFAGCSNLTKIKFPTFCKITTIGDSAFYNCSSLNSIKIPDDVTYIGDSAFYNCDSLTNINIPDSVTCIEDSAFRHCSSLTGIKIPSNVTVINAYTFDECYSLTRIGIPSSVTEIDYSAFDCTNSLKDVYYTGSESEWDNISIYYMNDCLEYATIHYNTGETEQSGTYYDQYGAWSYTLSDDCIGYKLSYYKERDNVTDIQIPDYINGVPVLELGFQVLSWRQNLISVVIPEGITTIGEQAFMCCSSLTSVTIPDTVTSIGDSAFSSCHYLTDVTIPDSVVTIGDQAFSYCYYITNITIPESVESIGERVFYYCERLTEIDVSPNNFFYTSLDGVLFNKSKTKLICYPRGKASDNYIIPDTVRIIDDYAFYYSFKLKKVTIPDTVTTIGESAFEWCNIFTDITIPDSVTYIGDSAFKWCDRLTDITIPDSVTYIGDLAFRDCNSLTSIEVSENNKNYSSVDGVLFDKEQTTLICYPEKKSLDIYTLPSSVVSICDYAFNNCYNLTNIIIPDGVTTIGEYAFYVCKNLTSITIPNSVTSVGGWAFDYCDGLCDVYYTGSKSEWDSLAVKFFYSDNLTIHYNYGKEIAGDINNDGELAVDDVIYVLKNIVGEAELTAEQIKIADVSGDGNLTVLDAVMIQRMILEA